MRVGLYGGSFDPLHYGHIQLIVALSEFHGLDEVWVCPAARSPFKNGPITLAEHRLTMARKALAPLFFVKVIDLECVRTPPSYTIDTVKTLLSIAQERGQPLSLHLLLGIDAANKLSLWKEAEQLVALAPPPYCFAQLFMGIRNRALPS